MTDFIIGKKEVKNIELVIFDRDGTLIDLFNYWSKMIGMRAQIICGALNLDKSDEIKMMFAMGVDLDNQRLRPEGPVGLKKREIVMQAAVEYLQTKSIPEVVTVCQEAFAKADQLSLARMVDLVKPIEGALSLINSLSSKGCKLAIATTDREGRARLTMESIGLLDSFSMIVGSDSVENSKPFTDMIDLISHRLNIAKENAIMVGDAISDVQMGLNAQVKASVGVCSGLTSRENLQKLTDYVIDDISEIKVQSRSK